MTTTVVMRIVMTGGMTGWIGGIPGMIMAGMISAARTEVGWDSGCSFGKGWLEWEWSLGKGGMGLEGSLEKGRMGRISVERWEGQGMVAQENGLGWKCSPWKSKREWE